MASTTSLPATRPGSKPANLWSGIDSTTMSASATASAAHRGSAPGTRIEVMRAIFSGSPEAAIDMWNPAAIAIRAITGPTCPAPSTAIRGRESSCICNNFTQAGPKSFQGWTFGRLVRTACRRAPPQAALDDLVGQPCHGRPFVGRDQAQHHVGHARFDEAPQQVACARRRLGAASQQNLDRALDLLRIATDGEAPLIEEAA